MQTGSTNTPYTWLFLSLAQFQYNVRYCMIGSAVPGQKIERGSVRNEACESQACTDMHS